MPGGQRSRPRPRPLVAYLATDDFTWEQALVIVGTATLVAVLKVVIGQNTGTDNSGALIGQPVIEPDPK